jgi:hypothetical protein
MPLTAKRFIKKVRKLAGKGVKAFGGPRAAELIAAEFLGAPSPKVTRKPANDANGGAPSRGRLSPRWQSVIDMIGAAKADGAGLDEVMGYCKAAGIASSRGAVRVMMFNYVKRGRLARNEDGRYQLSVGGAADETAFRNKKAQRKK